MMATFDPMFHKERERLTNWPPSIDEDSLIDILLLHCSELEDLFLQQGAKPDKDYTWRDLMNWAVQIHCAWAVKPVVKSMDEGAAMMKQGGKLK